jgi:N-acetylglucosamine kinase-like BadF-type ATPase
VPFLLGVDGGNSKTIALVATADGTIVGSGRGGCADIYGAVSPRAAAEAVAAAVAAALQAANLKPEDLAASCFSLAGADWPEDFAFWRRVLQRRQYKNKVVVVNDAIGALYAGLPSGIGVVVACGTGAATGARGADGELWHSSFWQETQGSSQLGYKTLRAVYRAELGLGPATSLTGRVLAFFELASVEQVLHRMTARQRRPAIPIERLARALLDEAQAGDAVAQGIVQEHGASLGDYAAVAARRVAIEPLPFTLVLTGGVLRHPSPLLGQAIVARVQATAPAVQAVTSQFEPAVGALLLARESAGLAPDEITLARLHATMPPSILFET